MQVRFLLILIFLTTKTVETKAQCESFLISDVNSNTSTDISSSFKTFKTVKGKERLVKTNTVFEYYDRTYHFKFTANLNPTYRHLVLDIRLVDEIDGLRSVKNGAVLYKQMMQHFGVNRIDVITGIWLEGTNFSAYKKNLETGLSMEDAAKKTWAGTMARMHGFNQVFIVKSKVDPKRKMKNQEVIVMFYRADTPEHVIEAIQYFLNF